MALLFNSSGQYLLRTTVSHSGNLFIGGWFYITSGSSFYMIYNGNGGSSGFGLVFDGTGAVGTPNRVRGLFGGVAFFASEAVNLGGWNFVALYRSGLSNHVIVNDVASSVYTGSYNSPSGGNLFAGLAWNNNNERRIAELFFYNDKLDLVSREGVRTGIPPYRCRPQNLIGYWPLWGQDSPEIDLHPRSTISTDLSFTTVSGSPTFTPHPPCTLWSPKWSASVAALSIAAPSVTGRMLPLLGVGG